MKNFSVSEQRQWLEDYEADLFHIACQRCGHPFKDGQYAIAAPAEWFGVIESLRDALDEIERMTTIKLVMRRTAWLRLRWWSLRNFLQGYRFSAIQRCRRCGHTTPFHYPACVHYTDTKGEA